MRSGTKIPIETCPIREQLVAPAAATCFEWRVRVAALTLRALRRAILFRGPRRHKPFITVMPSAFQRMQCLQRVTSTSSQVRRCYTVFIRAVPALLHRTLKPYFATAKLARKPPTTIVICPSRRMHYVLPVPPLQTPRIGGMFSHDAHASQMCGRAQRCTSVTVNEAVKPSSASRVRINNELFMG